MISEQKKMSDLTFQLIVESSPNAIVLIDKDGKIIYINHRTELLFGYSRTELIGELIEVLMPSSYQRRHVQLRDSYYAFPTARPMSARTDLYAKRKNNTEFPVEIALNPIVTNAQETLIFASIIDITERKKGEERFRLVVEAAPNAMVLVNREGLITLVNKQAEILFGYTREELLKKEIEILIPGRVSSHHGKDRNSFFENPKKRPMGIGRELFAKRKNLTEVQVEVSLNPIETAEGQMVLASIVDITERKLQESRIQEKQEELEIKNKELERFAFIASHDLQEPLRTVSNYMQVFKEDYWEKFDDQARHHIVSVNNAINRMSLLIKSLLTFSRLGRDKKITPVDLKKVIVEVMDDLQTQIQKSHVDIEISNMPILNGYEIEIRQLFQNLIANAIKFSRAGVKPLIQIYARETTGEWQISVKDNGIGIEPVYFDRIFDIFQRLNTQDKYEGSGIGLANCKKIVEFHHGKIWVESTFNQGTTINFTLSSRL